MPDQGLHCLVTFTPIKIPPKNLKIENNFLNLIKLRKSVQLAKIGGVIVDLVLNVLSLPS